MERAPNAKGHAALPTCPLEPSIPEHPTESVQRRPSMNNLKEPNPVPNVIQGSYEDPPGFIYPSYRAAGTEASGDKPSSRSLHQGVAYLSSAVGGSVSTLSFEDTKTSNRLSSHRRLGGGSRDRVRGFSKASRRNLLRRLASINRSAFRAFKGRLISITLTYPHEYPENPRSARTT